TPRPAAGVGGTDRVAGEDQPGGRCAARVVELAAVSVGEAAACHHAGDRLEPIGVDPRPQQRDQRCHGVEALLVPQLGSLLATSPVPLPGASGYWMRANAGAAAISSDAWQLSIDGCLVRPA